MQINHKKKRRSRIRIFFILFLFAICLTIHAFFCGAANGFETQANSKSAALNGDGNYTTYSGPDTETITENPLTLPKIYAIPKEIRPLFFFATLFISLPDRRTLMNQKVRLDN